MRPQPHLFASASQARWARRIRHRLGADAQCHPTVAKAERKVSSFDGTASIANAVVHIRGTCVARCDSGEERGVSEMAVQQLVYTAQAALQSSAPVQFRLDGDRTDQLLGVPVAEPVTRADQAATLAQVWIISPAEGAEVKSGFEVAGVGSFFEANVAWELREGDENGRVVASNADAPVTAQECCTMAPYSFTVDASPGEYTLVVHDEDMSDGEGFTPFQDTKALTVTR